MTKGAQKNMKIFKYIFKIALTNTLISILVIIGLVWVSQSFRSIKFILEKGGGFSDFIKLSFLSMPAWLAISISFGVFFGTFVRLFLGHFLTLF